MTVEETTGSLPWSSRGRKARLQERKNGRLLVSTINKRETWVQRLVLPELVFCLWKKSSNGRSAQCPFLLQDVPVPQRRCHVVFNETSTNCTSALEQTVAFYWNSALSRPCWDGTLACYTGACVITPERAFVWPEHTVNLIFLFWVEKSSRMPARYS